MRSRVSHLYGLNQIQMRTGIINLLHAEMVLKAVEDTDKDTQWELQVGRLGMVRVWLFPDYLFLLKNSSV